MLGRKCRLWANGEMHAIPGSYTHTDRFAGIWLEETCVLIHWFTGEQRYYEPATRFVYMPWVGQADRAGQDLFAADIVLFEGTEFEILWADEFCGFYLYPVTGCGLDSPIPLNRRIASDCLLTGNRYEHPDRLQTAPLQTLTHVPQLSHPL
jgi:hypothetical protein